MVVGIREIHDKQARNLSAQSVVREGQELGANIGDSETPDNFAALGDALFDDSQLAAIAAAWPHLSPEAKADVLAIVGRAAGVDFENG